MTLEDMRVHAKGWADAANRRYDDRVLNPVYASLCVAWNLTAALCERLERIAEALESKSE